MPKPKKPYSYLTKRSKTVRALNPVNAGLSHAAHEFDAALIAYKDAEKRFARACVEFNRCYDQFAPGCAQPESERYHVKA
jgi:hypothetical protein